MTDVPDWLRAHREKVATGNLPAPAHLWKPGQSGNPGGRVAGSKNKKTSVVEEFEKEGSAIARVVVEKAKAGDMTAATIALSRISPPLRPRGERVEFTLDADGVPSDQAKQIVLAVARGQLCIDDARFLIECLTAFVGLQELEAYSAERRRLLQGSRFPIPGGVLTT
jgi:uncharacterized protein DUF5681